MKNFLVLMVLFTGLTAHSQVLISGKVTDQKNQPLAGVSIAIKNSYDGTTSDSLGNFSFTTVEKGAQTLQTSISGYRPDEQILNLNNNITNLTLILKELITELKAVVISAGSFEASDKKKGAVLTALDIVTTASANGDVTEAFKSMPGTQQVGESEGLFVRGGAATESKIYMDGNLVNNFFYSSKPGIASRGRFNPFLFKGTIFSSGGYSALYGQALSAALILESNDLPERTEADLGITVVGAGGGIQKLAKNKKSSWGVSYNYTNLSLAFKLIPQRQDYIQVPVVHDGDANFRIKTRRGGFIKYYGYFSSNKLRLSEADIDSSSLKNAFGLRNGNIYQNLNWKETLGNGWKINTGISFSTNTDNISNQMMDANNQQTLILAPTFYAFKNFMLDTRSKYAQGRLVLEKKLQGLNAIRFGGDYFYSDDRSTYTLYNGASYKEKIIDQLGAAFAESDIYLTNDLAAKIGARVEHSALIGKWNLAPRVSVAYKFKNNGQLSFAYGIFYQNPERRFLPANNNNLDYSKAAHYILQYQRLNNSRTFRTELFYKKYDDLYKTGFGNNGREVASNNNGFGYAKGIEVFWRDKKSIKNVDYWISYSFLDTKRDYLNFPAAIQPAFAANHTAALVFKRFVLPWKTQFNLSYNFATGRPYYRFTYDNTQQKYQVAEQGKTINFNSMSFSVNYLPRIGSKNTRYFSVWVLGINNVLGQKQVFGYNYSNSGLNKQEVTSPSRRFVFIGCFLSFGIDRTQNAINNNL